MFQEEPIISVLMCVYNTYDEYLSEAIESIVGQTYSNIEFIIVDDGSTDTKTLDCLEHYASVDSRIRLIHNPENIGLTRSLNVGLGQCTGEYIARMDSDDVAVSNRLERQLEFMESHTEVALVGSNIVIFGDGIEEIDTRDIPRENLSRELHRIHSLVEHAGPPHPTFFIRKAFLDEHHISYREEIKKAQDYALMADIYIHQGIIDKLDESLLRYRSHSDQITATSSDEQKYYQKEISKRLIAAMFPELDEHDKECIASISSKVREFSVIEYLKAIYHICRLNAKKKIYRSNVLRSELYRYLRRKK